MLRCKLFQNNFTTVQIIDGRDSLFHGTSTPHKASQDATSQQSQQVHCGFPAPPHTLPKSLRADRKSLLKVQISAGIVPVRLLASSLSNSSDLIPPNSLGTFPLKLLPYIHNRRMLVSLPSWVGMVPLKLFSVMDHDWSVVRSPISVGIVPPKAGFLSIQTWKIRGIPTMKSNPPVRAESDTKICSSEFNWFKIVGIGWLNEFPLISR